MTTASDLINSGKNSEVTAGFKLVIIYVVAVLFAGSIVIHIHTDTMFGSSLYASSPASLRSWFSRPAGSSYGGSNYARDFEPPVRDLVKALRDATERAVERAPGRLKEELGFYSEQQRRVWAQANPCKSREELLLLYRQLGKDVTPNPQWDAVLREYSAMHRVCTRAAGNLTEYFRSRNESTGCKFVVASVHNGLGNKVLHLTSTFLYAVMTQRVMLIPSHTSVPDVMCEPFEGSSWRIEYALENEQGWKSPDDFFRNVDAAMAGNDSYSLYTSKVDNWEKPQSRFYCPTEQKFFEHVTWLSSHGIFTFIPKLFAIPSFRPMLEALFPDPSMTYTYLLRSVMLPNDVVWERARAVRASYLEPGDVQVGFQVRFILGKSYNKHNDLVNSNALKCSLEQGFLPEVFENFSSAPVLPQKKTKRIVVFIASLYSGLKEFLTSYYLKHRTISGDNVAVVQLTQTARQLTSTEEDREALVEILCLSFSNMLFVTGASTFGGLAQAYGATVPWFLSFKEPEADQPASCTRGQSMDICFQLANPKYTCPHDPELNNKHIVDSVPYFKACLDVDSGGVQLVTPKRTDSSGSPVT